MNISEIVTYTIPPRTRHREELSVCNVFFALLVLLIHTIAEPVNSFARDSFLYFLAVGVWRLSSFVVQGYFFLSGVKLFLGNRKEPVGKFYLGRLRRVVLPYAAVFCLFTLYFTVVGAVELTVGGFFSQLFTGKLCGHFYYVILIVQFYLLMPLWRLIVDKTDPFTGCITSLLLMVLCKQYLPDVISFLIGQPFGDNGLLFSSYLFYFVAGTYCGLYYDRFRILLDRYRPVFLTTWAILGAVNWIFIWLSGRGIYYALWLEGFHVLYCIYAILGCLSLGYLWRERKLFSLIFFRLADKWSYHVYLLHPLVIFWGDSIFWRIGLTSLSLRFVLRAILVYGSMAGLVWLAGKLPVRKKKKAEK